MVLKFTSCVCLFSLIGLSSLTLKAEVQRSAADGFQIELVRKVELDRTKAMQVLVEGLAQWWDADHSYSGDAANFSMDLKQGCLLEELPDGGFVRHMEIVFYQPGKLLRLTGGLGPLQEMGVQGAMTFRFDGSADGLTTIRMQYNVVGSQLQQLDQLAIVVDRVLAGQMDRLRDACARSAAAP